MSDDERVPTKGKWQQWLEERRAQWAREEKELYERLERNLRDNPPKAPELVEMPRMQLAEEDYDDVTLADRMLVGSPVRYHVEPSDIGIEDED